MDWVLFVRIAVWATFLLLVAGEIAACIFVPRFVKFYLKEHKKLAAEIKAVKRHLKLPDLTEAEKQ